ncbi:peptidase [Aurantiacibacter luteus]|uniref:ATP-dependent Clp protease proteolytic subunit n=1 Tax=Aurantiacibacter luteus TaxID=1581420 RepID=A0A0G9MP53_9SPHN|nr:peptidase [Aurantiacibacter luteus]
MSAYAPADVYQRWSAEAAGVRAVETGDNVITMFEDIGEDFWAGGGVTAKKVSAQLRAIGDRPVEVQINSPGGDMFEGIAIYNVLREHPQPITVKVMGMAASAASIIAMAGDTIEIGAASFLMIHNCWVVAIGNRHDMVETAEWLEPFDRAMSEVYAARSGQSVEAVQKWLDAETYMSGSIAVERGLADALLPADQVRSDDQTKAADQATNSLRAMELTLVSGGMSRSQARARINEIKGTPGAAPAGTPGAADEPDADLTASYDRLLAAMKSG